MGRAVRCGGGVPWRFAACCGEARPHPGVDSGTTRITQALGVMLGAVLGCWPILAWPVAKTRIHDAKVDVETPDVPVARVADRARLWQRAGGMVACGR